MLCLVEFRGLRWCWMVVGLLRKKVLVRWHCRDHRRLVGDVLGSRRLFGGCARVCAWLMGATLMLRQCRLSAEAPITRWLLADVRPSAGMDTPMAG